MAAEGEIQVRGTVYRPGDKSGFWIRWLDEDGRWKKKKVTDQRRTVDREDAERELHKRLDRVRGVRSGRIDPESERRLAEGSRPIEEQVERFETHLRARGGKEKHVLLTLARLRAAITWMKAGTIRDLRGSRIEAYLVHLIDGLGRSPKLRDEVLAVLRQFSRWSIAEKMTTEDPTERIRRLVTSATRRAMATFSRRPLTVDELWALAAAAERRPVENYLRRHPGAPDEKIAELEDRGRERGLAYLVLGYCGMRLRALRSLTWADVLANGARLRLRAEFAKNKRAQEVAVPPWLAERLRDHRLRQAQLRGGPVAESDMVFGDTREKLVRRLRADLEFAGIEEVTAAGRIDVHSLRVTCASLLVQSGAPLLVAQKQLGHSDIRVTAEVYAQLAPDAQDAAVAALPVPAKVAPKTMTTRRPGDVGS
jgi:integrase